VNKTSNDLALLRTYLALERNLLAEERTNLAELRTGLALIVIGPPASTVITLFINIPLLTAVTLILFTALTIIGIWLSIHSRVELNNIRQHQEKIRQQQRLLLDSSPELEKHFGNLIHPEQNNLE
jgi:uncharacterized membrane protein YidH (DUF202 family)